MGDQSWAMMGELVLSCNCTVFCPCVLSLGSHPPTEGYCQTWAGFRVDKGHFGDVDLSGLNLGLIMEIPGYMSRGNWTAGLFIDKRASIYATKAFTRIFTGKAGCIACHKAGAIGASPVGPDLSNIAGSQTPEYIMGKILDPASKGTVSGFPAGVMPKDFGQRLAAKEYLDLVSFLLTLKGGAAPAAKATP